MPIVQSAWHSPLPAGLDATYVDNPDGTQSYSGTGVGPFFSLAELVAAYKAANPGAGNAPAMNYSVRVLAVNEPTPADVPEDIVLLRRRS